MFAYSIPPHGSPSYLTLLEFLELESSWFLDLETKSGGRARS